MSGKGLGLFDFAYLFDVLSTLELKNQKKLIRYDVVEEFRSILIPQIGRELFTSIMQSQEYQNLFKANELTFNLVEAADKGEATPQQVHLTNKERYRAKQALQKKFFGGEMEIEKKSDRAK